MAMRFTVCCFEHSKASDAVPERWSDVLTVPVLSENKRQLVIKTEFSGMRQWGGFLCFRS